jgi:tartrate dehydrogenase/decarboxylase/D-malate dehydrogenase
VDQGVNQADTPIFEGTDPETVFQETVMMRIGVDRVLRYDFNLSQGRHKTEVNERHEK